MTIFLISFFIEFVISVLTYLDNSIVSVVTTVNTRHRKLIQIYIVATT